MGRTVPFCCPRVELSDMGHLRQFNCRRTAGVSCKEGAIRYGANRPYVYQYH